MKAEELEKEHEVKTSMDKIEYHIRRAFKLLDDVQESPHECERCGKGARILIDGLCLSCHDDDVWEQAKIVFKEEDDS